MTEPRTSPIRMSIVTAIGATTDMGPDIVMTNAALIDQRRDAEFIVIDDGASEPIRVELATRRGNCRVLHANPAYGTRDAFAIGANLAEGEIIVFVAPDLALTKDVLDQVLAPFASDPGVGIATARISYRNLAAGHAPPTVPPLVVLRRLALRSIGGTDALRASDNDPGEQRTTVMPKATLGALRAAMWRSFEMPATLSHSDGRMESWADQTFKRATTTPRPYWSPPFISASPSVGLNVIGLLDAACGVGEAARRYVDAIEMAEIACSTFSYHSHHSPELDYVHRNNRTLAYDTNLLALNPDLLPSFGVRGGREMWGSGRYSIGLWFWELEDLSPVVRTGFNYVNELWAASHFMREAFASATDRPVVHIPLPVPYEQGTPRRDRSALGLPDAFCFLTIFDFGSLAIRKNSLGVIRAFCEAFSPGEGPVLVLKTLNAAWDQKALEAIRQECAGRRDVLLLDGYLSDDVLNDLVGHADCFVSLHRSEGFGLTPAQAMAWGRPVIATEYSGNLDFMNRSNSYLVRASKSRVPISLSHVYPRGSSWAEPDLHEAARIMRAVYEDKAAAIARGIIGQRDIRRTNSTRAAAGAIAERFGELSSLRRAQRATQRDAKRGALAGSARG